MISHMGDSEENSSGNFLLLDGETFEIKGKWTSENMKFGYDFWYSFISIHYLYVSDKMPMTIIFMKTTHLQKSLHGIFHASELLHSFFPLNFLPSFRQSLAINKHPFFFLFHLKYKFLQL